MIKIIFKIDFEIGLKLNQARIAKIFADSNTDLGLAISRIFFFGKKIFEIISPLGVKRILFIPRGEKN